MPPIFEVWALDARHSAAARFPLWRRAAPRARKIADGARLTGRARPVSLHRPPDYRRGKHRCASQPGRIPRDHTAVDGLHTIHVLFQPRTGRRRRSLVMIAMTSTLWANCSPPIWNQMCPLQTSRGMRISGPPRGGLRHPGPATRCGHHSTDFRLAGPASQASA